MKMPSMQLVDTVRSLLEKGGARQSAAGGEPIDERDLVRAIEGYLDARAGRRGGLAAPAVAPAAAVEVVSHARRALDRVAAGQSATNLSDLEISSLQAIVEVVGRPAMRYRDGRVETPPSTLGDNDHWQVVVMSARSKINQRSASVGRVALDDAAEGSGLVGTAWRLGADLVVTNRHVARELVGRPEAPCAGWRLDPAKPSSVDFAATDGAPAPRRFAVAELAYCAEETEVDLAVLRLAAGNEALPPALPLDLAPEALGSERVAAGGAAPSFQGEEIYVVGHPFRRRRSPATVAVFGDADGRKRCSPGQVTAIEPQAPLLEHDCSTLGGNSGSCVISVNGHAVVGLHCGSLGVDEESARGRANVALALSRLGGHRAGRILGQGRLVP